VASAPGKTPAHVPLAPAPFGSIHRFTAIDPATPLPYTMGVNQYFYQPSMKELADNGLGILIGKIIIIIRYRSNFVLIIHDIFPHEKII
jgi:hypothetical protein